MIADTAASAVDPGFFSLRILISPGHARRVVGDAEATAGVEQDHAAVAVKTALQILHGFLCHGVRRAAIAYAIGRPLGENELHDRLAPSRAGSSGAEVIGIAAAADQ